LVAYQPQMHSADQEVLQSAIDWLEEGADVFLVTVAKTWGSSPRPVGSLMAVTGDGRWAGSVSGGCVEQHLIKRLRSESSSLSALEVITYGVTQQEAIQFGLPCGGRLELVVEALHAIAPLRTILNIMHAREMVVRRICLQTGEVSIHNTRRDREFSYDGRNMEKIFGPAWRLLIIGAGHLSQYVAQMALALDYHVIVCDPREQVSSAWHIPGIQIDVRMPDDAVKAFATDPRSAVIALTHDPKLDDMALMEALESDAFYVGALGSRANSGKRRERLAWLGVTAPALERLHAPVGLPIGSRSAAEIAVSILAGLTAARHDAHLQATDPIAEPSRQGGPQEMQVKPSVIQSVIGQKQ
jgi:xanthine dehydrogenase accessory factor